MSKTTEPTPQEPLGDSEGTATSAVVGLESVAFMTHHDEPMLFPTWDEAVQYCDDDESPISLFHADDVAKLQADLATMTQERDKYKDSVEHYGDLYAKLAAITQKPDHFEKATAAHFNQLSASQAENEALRKDAERWRFFRMADWADWNAVFRVDHDGLSLPELLDKATDAAMKG